MTEENNKESAEHNINFTHLHVHTEYSILDGLSKVDDLLDYVKENGMDSVAITDHGALYGAIDFYKKAKDKGIKPIIGAEVYMALGKLDSKKPNIDNKSYHLVLLAKNEEGYRNLVKLLTTAHLEGFYYKPRIDEDLLAKHASGLVALSSCIQGKIPRLILTNKREEAKKLALYYRDLFGKDSFYLEMQHHPNIEEQKTVNDALVEISKETSIPLVATCDSHYLRPEDAKTQDILMSIGTGSDIDNPERLTMEGDDFSLRTPEEMKEFFKHTPEALHNTQKIKDICNLELQLGKTVLPHYPLPEGITADEKLRELCEKGIKKRYPEEEKEKVLKRLDAEMEVITGANLSSYFLIVQDFVNWAKAERIVVGPGRGSAGGSIIAYLLGITSIDPLRYDLLFERFLNPGRAKVSLPDIDLDFADRRRDEVIHYIADKYGKDNVAQIITFGTMAARAAIRDVGRTLSYSYSYCDKIAKLIPFGSTLKETKENTSEFRQLYDTDENAQVLIDHAEKLEGVVRHASTHACGVVISDKPLHTSVPLQNPTQNEDTVVTQYAMEDVEDMGLLKIDLLGLKNLTIIEDTLKRIHAVRGESLDIENIPLDDEKAFHLLQEGKTVGVFQLECLSGNTIISNTTIEKLYKKRDKKRLCSLYLDSGKIHLNEVIDVVKTGKKKTYTLIAENDWYIRATENHRFLTKDGWKKLKEIKVNDKVLIREKAKHLVYRSCKSCNKQIYDNPKKETTFCYRCSAKTYKNPSKPISRKKIRESREKFYAQGGKPWNHGLNKTNSQIWRETSEKIAKALSGRSLEDRCGKEWTDAFKKCMSKKFSGSGNPMFGKPSPHSKKGFRKDLGHFVRSSWEADFARILKLYKLKYQYEPKTFFLKRKNGEIIHYTPDFFVPLKNTFYEVKGFLRDLDEEKINLFKEQYPQYKFVLINTTRFAELSLDHKNLIKWECPQTPKEGFRFVRIKKIQYFGEETTYDIKMKSPGNNFQASGFIVHNSGGMQRYLKQLKPTDIEEVIAMVSLYRPGPIKFIPDYIEKKHGKKEITYMHPLLEPILKPTYGVCVYQEQVMKIAQNLAGYTLEDADVLRKAIGKKIEKLLKGQKEKFISGIKAKGIDKEIGEKLWSWIEPFAQYSFNKSHAAAYAQVAYQTAFLKTHYPKEFMSSLLTADQNDTERIGFLIDDCNRMNIKVLPPDINESFMGFGVVPNKNEIRFGLSAIKNVGLKIVEEIVKERKENGSFKSLDDFLTRVDSQNLNKKSMESLILSGAFDKFRERGELIHNLERILEYSKEKRKHKNNGQTGLFDTLKKESDLKLEKAPKINKKEKLEWEKQLLGLFITGHPLQELTEKIKNGSIPIREAKKQMSESRVRIGVIVSSVKKIITKSGEPMYFVKVEDLADNTEVIVFPRALKKNGSLFKEGKPLFISGKISHRDEVPKIICESAEEIK